MAGSNKIIIKASRNKQKYVVVKSANNKTLANTETYKTKQGVENAVSALKKLLKMPKLLTKRKRNRLLKGAWKKRPIS